MLFRLSVTHANRCDTLPLLGLLANLNTCPSLNASGQPACFLALDGFFALDVDVLAHGAIQPQAGSRSSLLPRRRLDAGAMSI